MNRMHPADYGAHRQMGSATPLQREARGPLTQPGELEDRFQQAMAELTYADMGRAYWRGWFHGFVSLAALLCLTALAVWAQGAVS